MMTKKEICWSETLDSTMIGLDEILSICNKNLTFDMTKVHINLSVEYYDYTVRTAVVGYRLETDEEFQARCLAEEKKKEARAKAKAKREANKALGKPTKKVTKAESKTVTELKAEVARLKRLINKTK